MNFDWQHVGRRPDPMTSIANSHSEYNIFDFGVRYVTARIKDKATTFRVATNNATDVHYWSTLGPGSITGQSTGSYLARFLAKAAAADCRPCGLRSPAGGNMRPLFFFALSLAWTASAQTPKCVPPSNQQLIIYRAGSRTRAFKPLEDAFTCQTGIQVKDTAMGSVDAGRQITAGGQACDLYAPADYLDIDLFMKTRRLCGFRYRVRPRTDGADVFGERVSFEEIAADRREPGAFHPPASIPKAGREMV